MAWRNTWAGHAMIAALLWTGCGTETGPGAESPSPEIDAGIDAEIDPEIEPEIDDEVFESDLPQRDNRGGPALDGGVAGDGDGDGDSSGDGDAAGIIAEADVVHVDSDRLYALSRYAGLSIVDLGDLTALRVLGSFAFEPELEGFEMYARGDAVLALTRPIELPYWLDHTEAQSSELAVLDVSDPSEVVVLDSLELQGNTEDSRIVGDVLYVVHRIIDSCFVCAEDGMCTWCNGGNRVVVTSIDITDPRAPRRIDEITLTDDVAAYGHVFAVELTPTRAYVSGGNNQGGSKLQVVDISDPSGEIELGAQVWIDGILTNRWQMDEHDGVLRTVSQRGSVSPPVLETFEIASSHEITPVGSLSMTLPRPEELKSVRFDGDRAYAITFEQTDPLFTLDVSDPAKPRQLGELEIPGWVYHMVPRGDRLLGVGYDDDADDGVLHASLFDVTDLSAPTMLSRVNFGGHEAHLVEDQNRIEKAFTVLDDAGLVLVPFDGELENGDGECDAVYSGRVQLIELGRSTLTRRGLAQIGHQAKRALLHDGDLVAVAEDRIKTFDLSDLDAPRALGSAVLARDVLAATRAGDHVVRLVRGSSSVRPRLEVVAADNPNAHEVASVVELALDKNDEGCRSSFDLIDLAATSERVHIVYAMRRWDTRDAVLGVQSVDISDPSTPRVVGHEELTSRLGDTFDGLRWVGSIGDAMIALDASIDLSDDALPELSLAELVILDLSQPNEPVKSRLPLDPLPRDVRVALSPDLAVVGTMRSGAETDRVRYYAQRLDLSEPGDPKLTEAVNVPGMVQDVVDDHRLITQSFDRGLNDAPVASLHLVRWNATSATLAATYDFEPDEFATDVAVGDDRAFVMSTKWGEKLVFSSLEQDAVEANVVEVPPILGQGAVTAAGEQAMVVGLNGALWIDAQDLNGITVSPIARGCSAATYADGTVYCAHGGYYRVTTWPLLP